MGGYFRNSNPTPADDQLNPEHLAALFFKYKNSATRMEILRDLYSTLEAQSKSVIDYLSAHKKLPGLKKEFKDLEVEIKLEVPAHENLEALLKSYQVKETSDRLFLKNSISQKRNDIPHYCFGDEEERFVLMQSDKGMTFKEKVPVNESPIKIPDGHYILRRKESIKIVYGNLESLVGFSNLMLAASKAKDVELKGSFLKTRYVQYALEAYSGRVYSYVLSDCRVKDTEKRLLQLEIKYCGYLPDFLKKENIEDEKEIAADLLCQAYSLRDDYGLKLTTLTKYEWLTGKKQKEPFCFQSEVSAEQNDALTGQQVIFNQTVTRQP